MKKVYFCILLILFQLSLFGIIDNNAVEGIILNPDGEPLVGASVVLKGTSMGTFSDANGNFELKNVASGTYLLQVSYMGYQTYEKNITVPISTKLEVKLQISSIRTDEVIISATRASRKAPFAIHEISKEDMEAQTSGEEIPFLLQLSPSVVAFSENGTALGNTAFRIRGSDPSRLNVTVNGIPLNDPESQTVFWVNMSDFGESVENIQLQRGVGSSTNGAASFGSSINMQTSNYTKDAGGEVTSMIGSFNTYKNSVKVSSGLINNHFAFDARLSHSASDGYIKHSGLEHKSMYFSGGYFDEKSMLKFVFWNNDEQTDISWWGVPDYLLETDRRYNPAGVYEDANGNEKYYEDQQDNYIQKHYQLHFSHKLSNNLTANAALHYTKGAGYYEQYQDDANWFHDTYFSSYGLNTLSYMVNDSTQLYASDLVRRRWLDNDFYGATWSVNYDNNKLKILVGGGLNRYNGDHFGEIIWVENNPGIPKEYEYYFNNSIKDEFNVFAKVEYEIQSNLTAFADVQIRYIDYTLKGITSKLDTMNIHNTYPFFNPKAGVSYQYGKSRIYASIAMAHREPTRANLQDAIGSPRTMPKEESLIDYEAGYMYHSGIISGAANAFYMSYKNQLVPTGEKSDVGYDIMTNVPKSYRTGIELSGAVKPIKYLKWELNTTLSQNKIVNFKEYLTYYDADWVYLDYEPSERGNTNLAYSPNIIAGSNISIYAPYGIRINFISRYVGEQYFDNTSDAEALIDNYFINDLAISYNIPVKQVKSATFQFKINNLFDVDYISNAYGGKDMVGGEASRWTYYFPQAGMNFMAQLKVKI